MEKEKLKRIFEFLEEKGEHNAPFKWKLINNKPFAEEDLYIDGDLDLKYLDIKSLPEGLEVGGDLLLHSTNIEFLPEGLKVGGDLNLFYCQKLKSLPKGLEVGGLLWLHWSGLKNYSNDEIIKMIKPGIIKGEILR
jgi:hypothetical protein